MPVSSVIGPGTMIMVFLISEPLLAMTAAGRMFFSHAKFVQTLLNICKKRLATL